MLKNISLSIRTKNARKRIRNHRESIPFDQSQKIGILFDERSGRHDDLSKMVQELKAIGKKVQVLCFLPQNIIPSLGFDYSTFSPKDIRWNGTFISPSVDKFIKTEFDYLFSLNTSPFLPLENILANSQARCRVGFYTEKNLPYCDLLVQSSNTNSSKGPDFDDLLLYAKKI